MNKMTDTEKITELQKQRDGLFACVNFALTHFHLRSGSGSVMTTLPDGNVELEHWTEWFIREIENCGVKIDRDILEYNRASQKEKQSMRKDPKFMTKLEAAKS